MEKRERPLPEIPETVHLLFADDDPKYMAVAQHLLAKYQGKKFDIVWKKDGMSAISELEKNPSIKLLLIDY